MAVWERESGAWLCVRGSSRGCNVLTGMQNHPAAFDVPLQPLKAAAAVCDLREVEPGGNVIVFIVEAPSLAVGRTVRTHEGIPSPSLFSSAFPAPLQRVHSRCVAGANDATVWRFALFLFFPFNFPLSSQVSHFVVIN